MKLAKAILCVLIVSLLLSAAIPMVSAKGPPDKPPKPPGGKEEPAADPVIAVVTPTGRGWNSLVVMNADGSNKVEVLGGFHLDTPSWSPDGSSIAFTEYYEELWRIDVVIDDDGVPRGESKTLLFDGMLEGPEWSPAECPLGDVILFTRFPDGGGWPISLEVIPAGGLPPGDDPQILYTDPAGTVWNPVWSPDGNSIAFVRSVGGVYSLGIYNVATSGTSFKDLPTKPTCLDWARTQDEIAYSIKYKERNKWIFELYTVDINLGTINFLFQGKNPTWSPDDKLCFEYTGLMVHDFDTGESEQISKWGYYPDWCRRPPVLP